MHPFRNLLLIAVGKATSFEKNPSPQEWERLYVMSHQQSMVGILNGAVHQIPQDQWPSEDLLRKWDENTAKISRIYHLHEQRVKELEELLRRLGLHGCILKGTGLAYLYPRPEWRMYGDIDIWIAGNRDAVIHAFEDAGIPIFDILYQESKAGIFLDTDVEVHFHPCKMYNPFCNARLQRFFENNSPIRDEETITYPDTKFNAVFCMAHMFRHYLEGGIGMRQMLDYYYILKNLDPADRKPVMRVLKRLGMGRFTASVMTSMWYNFGLEDEYLLCPIDLKHGKKLVNDIIAMGNFGVLDKRNQTPENETKWARFLRKNRRVFSNFNDYPCEIFWSPFARVSQFVWRKVKGYL